jgi:hypothetical protein
MILILMTICLQITLWDYIRYGVNDFLGEVIVDLHNHPLDDEPEWYMLKQHQESNYPGGVRKTQIIFCALENRNENFF